MTGMQMAMMGGVNDPPVTLSNQSPNALSFSPTPASAVYGVINDRTVFSTAEAPANWLPAGAAVGNYDVRIDMISGTLTSGDTISAWLDLSTSRQWQLDQAATGLNQASFTVQIRLRSTGVVKATATIDMSAEVIVYLTI